MAGRSFRNSRVDRLVGITLVAVLAACADKPAPTAPEEGRVDLSDEATELPAALSANAVLSDRAHLLAGDGFNLIASEEETAAGTLCFL